MHRTLLCALLLVGAAMAQEPNYDSAADALGVWQLSVEPPEDNGPIDVRRCSLEFLASETDGRFDLASGPDCAAAFPALATAAAWTAHDSGADIVDRAGRPVMGLVHRGPSWMLGGIEGDATRYTLNQATPRGVRAMAGEYYISNDTDVPFATCTAMLGEWHAPIAKGATHVAYGLRQGEDCRSDVLGEAVAWRPLPDPQGGWLIVFLSADQRELGRFAEREGWDLAMFGRFKDAPFKLAKVQR